jgi:cytochrome P450
MEMLAMTTLPKGPRFNLLQKLRYARDPVGFMTYCRNKYGDPFTIRTMLGTVVMTADPDLARQVFAGPRQGFGVSTARLLTPLLGEHSLILEEGEAHLKHRKILTPHFHGAALSGYADRICAIARRQVSKLLEQDRVVIQDHTQNISLNIIIETVFGVTGGAQQSRLATAIKARIAASNPLLVFLPWTRRSLFGWSAWDRFSAASAQLDALIFAEIRARRAQPNRPAKAEDVLSHLIEAPHDHDSGLSDQQIRDQLITLLLAGHDTTASATAWAMHWIHRDGHLLTRLQSELRQGGETAADISANAFLEAVCCETLRLSPVIPDVVRYLKAPFTLGDYTLPAGINIGVCTALIHQHPDVFDQPTQFMPERFIERRYRSNEFMPFGGGVRKCIGAAFALEEMKMILATIIGAVDLKLPPNSNPEQRAVRNHFTMGPEGGVPMVHR